MTQTDALEDETTRKMVEEEIEVLSLSVSFHHLTDMSLMTESSQ